jgi:hypothetical protein
MKDWMHQSSAPEPATGWRQKKVAEVDIAKILHVIA